MKMSRLGMANNFEKGNKVERFYYNFNIYKTIDIKTLYY